MSQPAGMSRADVSINTKEEGHHRLQGETAPTLLNIRGDCMAKVSSFKLWGLISLWTSPGQKTQLQCWGRPNSDSTSCRVSREEQTGGEAAADAVQLHHREPVWIDQLLYSVNQNLRNVSATCRIYDDSRQLWRQQKVPTWYRQGVSNKMVSECRNEYQETF